MYKKIEEYSERPTVFEYSPEKPPCELRGACGLALRQFSGGEEAGEEFQEMEKEAEGNLVRKKLEEIDRLIKETIDVGKKITVSDYIDILTEKWGTRRITSNVMRIILEHIKAKTILEVTQH